MKFITKDEIDAQNAFKFAFNKAVNDVVKAMIEGKEVNELKIVALEAAAKVGITEIDFEDAKAKYEAKLAKQEEAKKNRKQVK